MPKNIFVVGLDPFNLAQLQALEGADRYRFHALTDYREVKETGGLPVGEILDRGRQILERFPVRWTPLSATGTSR